jgi:hypothetical protein
LPKNLYGNNRIIAIHAQLMRAAFSPACPASICLK